MVFLLSHPQFSHSAGHLFFVCSFPAGISKMVLLAGALGSLQNYNGSLEIEKERKNTRKVKLERWPSTDDNN